MHVANIDLQYSVYGYVQVLPIFTTILIRPDPNSVDPFDHLFWHMILKKNWTNYQKRAIFIFIEKNPCIKNLPN